MRTHAMSTGATSVLPVLPGIRRRGDLHRVARPDDPARYHLGENTLPRHHAIAHLLVDRASRMAFFADLRDLELDVAADRVRCLCVLNSRLN